MLLEVQFGFWTLLSLTSAIIVYLILTEAENKYLLGTTVFFGIAIGMISGVFWIEMTNGMQFLSPMYYILPCIISSCSEVLLLSYYKFYHRSAFPRVPSFKVGTVALVLSLIAVFFLAFLTTTSYMPVVQEASLPQEISVQIAEARELSLDFVQEKSSLVFIGFIVATIFIGSMIVYMLATRKYVK